MREPTDLFIFIHYACPILVHLELALSEPGPGAAEGTDGKGGESVNMAPTLRVKRRKNSGMTKAGHGLFKDVGGLR